ncbi:unnamed protein product [Lasius platythorax]|uniref:Uncharacterized protein n=1 Tax=Lasius platythorax TaxID=488582 RepID=A0AAV2NPK5_9HYME
MYRTCKPEYLPREVKDYELDEGLQSTNTMESIKKYLEIKHLVNAAADAVLKEKKNLHQMAKNYGIECSILHQKVSIMKLLETYLDNKFKYEAAVKAVLFEKQIIKFAAEKYQIDCRSLCEEIVWFSNSGEETYEFDRSFDSLLRTFTFKEELSLLKSLELWKTEGRPFCSCELCSLEKLLYIAYQFAQEKKIKYPKTWDIEKRATVGWLIGFEMAHSKLISKLVSRNECFRLPELRWKPDFATFYLLKFAGKKKIYN